jgi:hypothetical protein
MATLLIVILRWPSHSVSKTRVNALMARPSKDDSQNWAAAALRGSPLTRLAPQGDGGFQISS